MSAVAVAAEVPEEAARRRAGAGWLLLAPALTLLAVPVFCSDSS